MIETFILAATAIVIFALLCATALAAWRGWLALRHAELRPASAGTSSEPDTGQLIELAAIKERLRRLEAIANLVD